MSGEGELLFAPTFRVHLYPLYNSYIGLSTNVRTIFVHLYLDLLIFYHYQDLGSTAIYSVFLIIILDIYTTVSAFP